MILAFELTWAGTHHATTNAAMVQTLARAFPGQEIRVFAEATHLLELCRDPQVAGLEDLSIQAIAADQTGYGKTHLVSCRRLGRELRTLYRAIKAVDPAEECLIVLLSATSTAIFALSWLLRLFRSRRLGAHVVLHGNLHEITDGRWSRNPLMSALGLRSALSRIRQQRLRFIVLEEAIRQRVGAMLPDAAGRFDVLPHPVNPSEAAAPAPRRLAAPLKIGFVGLATGAKGIDTFLAVAAEMKRRFGPRIEFHHVGAVPAGTPDDGFAVLADPVSRQPLARAEFQRRIAELHYVMLPYQAGYYELSASGALTDALIWQKPVLATPLPFVEELFAAGGNIGFLCADQEEFCDALTAAMDLDSARYARQVENLGALRASRLPEALGPSYRNLVLARFEGLLAAPVVPPRLPAIEPKRRAASAA